MEGEWPKLFLIATICFLLFFFFFYSEKNLYNSLKMDFQSSEESTATLEKYGQTLRGHTFRHDMFVTQVSAS